MTRRAWCGPWVHWRQWNARTIGWRSGDRLSDRRGKELTWDWLLSCEALLVQRPWLPVHAQLMVQAKMMGMPVWVDWDDDYLSISPQQSKRAAFPVQGVREKLE